MPELPEVETIVREMREKNLCGLKIEKAEVFWPKTIATPALATFIKEIENQVIVNIARRGKFLVFTLTRDTLLVHLRMTGKFLLSEESAEKKTHEHVRLHLSDKRVLKYEDQRKFGRWYLLENPHEKLQSIGLEPLEKTFTLQAFKSALNKHKTQIKAFLLNQKYIAGLGNIYVDEALWEAKIHPLRSIDSLTMSELKALHQAIPKVLQKGVDNLGTSLGAHRANYFSVSGRRGGNQYQLNVFRQNGLECPRCHLIIIKTVVAQRGTHICLSCQKL